MTSRNWLAISAGMFTASGITELIGSSHGPSSIIAGVCLFIYGLTKGTETK